MRAGLEGATQKQTSNYNSQIPNKSQIQSFNDQKHQAFGF